FYSPPANRKLELVALNDSRLSIRPVAGTSKVSLACMKKPHAPVPISVKASEAPKVQTGLRVRRMVVAAMSMLRELRKAKEL
ncbi:hypothetical protein, partial [Ralstonia pickettii]|uniref:hypothetical protein n=1 Tax=Ralstonia pickettii TaxID=329 RepID=UPI00293090DA